MFPVTTLLLLIYRDSRHYTSRFSSLSPARCRGTCAVIVAIPSVSIFKLESISRDIKMKPYDNKVVCLVMRCGSKAVEVRSFLRTLAPRQQFVLSCGRKLRASWAFVYWNRIQVFISPSSLSLEHAKENKMHIILSRRDDFFPLLR